MSITGTQIVNRINAYANDSANAIWSAAQKLEAVNAAIDAAFPSIAQVKLDTSVTLAVNVFEYAPTATDVTLERGFANAYATPNSTTSQTKVPLLHIGQRLGTTTWTIIVPPYIASEFNGNVLNLQYNARLARLSAVGDSVELPLDYAFNYAMWWLSGSSMISKINSDRKVAQSQMDFYYQNARQILISNARGQIKHNIPAVHGWTELETGSSASDEYTGTVRL